MGIEDSGLRRAMSAATGKVSQQVSQRPVLAHAASGGVVGVGTLVSILMLVNPQIKAVQSAADSANTRADSAAQAVSRMEGTLQGMAKNLEWFMMMQGVKPLTKPVPVDSTPLPEAVPDTADTN